MGDRVIYDHHGAHCRHLSACARHRSVCVPRVPGVQAYFKLRGKRLVTCLPQTEGAAAVEVAATETALGAFVNEPTLRLKQCFRWPERQNCGQQRLEQIAADPQNCLVWNMVENWYEGKSCVFCHKPIGQLRHLDRVPAFLRPDFKTSEWKDVTAEALPKTSLDLLTGLLEL